MNETTTPHPGPMASSSSAERPQPEGNMTERLTEQARDAAGQVREEASGLIAELRQEGGEVLQAARKRAETMLDDRREAGAEQVESTARAVHDAASQLEDSVPGVARYVHEAASAIEEVSRTLRDSSPGEMVGRIEELARRQPVAFFGTAMLAGFALTRFARSSAERSHRHAQGHAPGRSDTRQNAGAWRRDPEGEPHPSGTVSSHPGAPLAATATSAATMGGALAHQEAQAGRSTPRAEGRI